MISNSCFFLDKDSFVSNPIANLVMILKAAYQKPQGILLKLTLENLEISGNFVLEIGWTPCLRKMSLSNSVERQELSMTR